MWDTYSVEDYNVVTGHVTHILYVSWRIGWFIIRVALTRGTSIWIDGNREKTIIEYITWHTYTQRVRIFYVH